MSIADEFVKALAAVKCDHSVSDPGVTAGVVSFVPSLPTRADIERWMREQKEAAEARCCFCIARCLTSEKKT